METKTPLFSFHPPFSPPIRYGRCGKMETIDKKNRKRDKDVIKKNIKVLYKQKDGRIREYYVTLLFFLTK